MTEPLELRGRWWLPEHEEHQVFGTLSWNAEEGGSLHLHDELRPVIWRDNVRSDGTVQKYRADRSDVQRTYPLIFGRVGRTAYTLLDSFRLTAREFDEDNRTETVHVNRFLQGAWFDDPDELRVDRLMIDMRHLTGWVKHSGLEVNWPRFDGGDSEVFACITARICPPFATKHERLTFRLSQRLGGTGDHLHGLGVNQSWSLSLQHPAPEPLDTFLQSASDFQDLVSIAIGKTAQFEEVILHHPQVPQLSAAGTPIRDLRRDIAYYVRWSNRTTPCEPVKDNDMYFTFDDFGGIDGVGRWLAVAADYRTELRRVMATRYREGMVLEDRIMNISAAIDSFDRHRRGTGKWVEYRKRVKHCVELAGRTFRDLIVIDIDLWVDQVVNTRDDLAHHRERFRSRGSVGEHLLSEQLFWLFVCCMLQLSDAPREVYERIDRHSQIRWLTGRAAGAAGGSS